MSRTKRIYNREIYKKRTLRHYNAKFANGQYYLRSMYDVTPEEALEQGIPIYAGPYAYHKYKCLGMKCQEDYPKKVLSRKQRRKLRKEERNAYDRNSSEGSNEL